MADNRCGWKQPHTGRLGVGSGYVSEQGFGHEDWNFAGHVWDDGRYHLYLKMKPKREDLNNTFNIVLGLHTKLGAMILGFAENVQYGQANLADHIWERRAQEVKALEEGRQLGPLYSGKSTKQIKKALMAEREIYNVSVSPADLYVLNQPLLIPVAAYEVTTPQYRLLVMTAEQYAAVTEAVSDTDIGSSVNFDDDSSFPEGAQIERLHRSRERSRKLVNLAKEAFLKLHGSLYCEACGMVPSEYFNDASLAGRIIEAHHNVGIADAAHSGKTQIGDLSMLCPSCHRAIHSMRPWLSVEELRKRLKR
ncbi:HNH endonuclease [Roseovarius sp.]|uniref:HNH endonuclease n=1 Tax=Roseovarius sp. TaxID=1486281 RepID=UPI003D0CFA56